MKVKVLIEELSKRPQNFDIFCIDDDGEKQEPKIFSHQNADDDEWEVYLEIGY